MTKQDVKKGQVTIGFHLHSEPDAIFYHIEVLHSITGQHSAGVIDIPLPEWKFNVKGGQSPVLNILHN